MATSKKRSFDDLNNQNHHTTDEPSTKKQKLNKLSSTIRSNLFQNSCDNKQFQTIFDSIDNSQLVKQLNISHIISKEIAEHSTGNIKHCANNECKTEIFILNEYIEKYKSDHSNSDELGFKYCCDSKKYYCNKCMKYTVMLSNDELYWSLDFESIKCVNCYGIIPTVCNVDFESIKWDCDSSCLDGFKLVTCYGCKGNDALLCFNCYENDYSYERYECDECREMFCNDCLAYGEGNVYFCKKCAQETSVKCDGNCGQMISTLIYDAKGLEDPMSCLICDAMFFECCSDGMNYCVECYRNEEWICEKCSKSNGCFNQDNEYICNECFNIQLFIN